MTGSLGTGNLSEHVSFPGNSVPGSEQLVLSVFPAFLASVVNGMDSLLQEPTGCFEQTSSTTWPNVLVEEVADGSADQLPEIFFKKAGEKIRGRKYSRWLRDTRDHLADISHSLWDLSDEEKAAITSWSHLERYSRDWHAQQIRRAQHCDRSGQDR